MDERTTRKESLVADVRHIGQQIAHHRKVRKMTAESLATASGAGLTRDILANIENGRREDIGITHLVAIANALDIPLTSLLEAPRASVPENWVTVRHAADHFGVSINTIRAWIRVGRINANRVGPKLIRVDIASAARPVGNEQ